MLDSPAYRSLSCHARCLLVELGRRYTGENNGNIPMSVREAARLLGAGKNTAQKAFSELEDRGFIRPNVKGAFTFKARHATTWILTEYKHGDERATKDFMKWKPTPIKQKPVSPRGTDSTSEGDRVPVRGTDKSAHGTPERDRKGQNSQTTVPLEGTLYSIPQGVRSLGAAKAPRK